MTTATESPGDCASPSSRRTSVRYRNSCDRCQNIKVRCSQEKPACRRCVHKGVNCVYSPLRRIGRPKKSEQGAVTEAGVDENLQAQLATTSTPGSASISDQQYAFSDSHRINQPTNSSMTSPMASTHSNCNVDMPSNLDIHVRNGRVNHSYSSESIPQSYDIWSPNQPLSAAIFSNNSVQALDDESRTGINNVRNDVRINSYPASVADCYVSILARTAKLEQLSASLVTTTPPIDLVLEAERDLRTLIRRCFACLDHTNLTQDSVTSNRPISLSICLLADRVVSMLEETFRYAAETATAPNSAIQDPSGYPLPASSARRLDRSFRGLLDLPCIFPIPAGNIDVRVGDHIVDGPVKARAVKRILQLRIRKLLVMLNGMRKLPQVDRQGESVTGPLDWGGSAKTLNDAASLLIEDLTRRVESLQGAMALMG